MELRSYSPSDVLRAVPETADGAVPEDLDQRDLGLAVHLAKYFSRRFANALRLKMRTQKRSYDREGLEEKTPFALRNITDPLERAMILGNIHAFATTHGCTGGCEWCCYDAFITGDVEVIPFGQKKHFFDELDALLETDSARVYAVKNLMLYFDTDPFDDLDIVELLSYVYGQVGVTPCVSTVVPRRGEENFKKLAWAAKQYCELREVQMHAARVKESPGLLKDFPQIGTLGELAAIEGRFDDIDELGRIRGRIRMGFYTQYMPFYLVEGGDDLLKSFGHLDFFKSVERLFARFGIGKVSDCVERSDEIIAAIDRAIEAENAALQSLQYFENTHIMLIIRMACEFLREKYACKIPDDLLQKPINEAFDELNGIFARIVGEYREKLGTLPDMGSVRVSVVPYREAVVKELRRSDDYLFSTENRLDSSDVFPAGVAFLRRSKEAPVERENKSGISCRNGLELSPFVLLNTVAGHITDRYPQGRIMVPYKGLQTDNVLAESGQLLGEVLSHVIVIDDCRFYSGSGKGTPSKIYVYDGDHRIREINFDHDTYRIVSDVVVQERVMSLRDIADLKKDVWEASE